MVLKLDKLAAFEFQETFPHVAVMTGTVSVCFFKGSNYLLFSSVGSVVPKTGYFDSAGAIYSKLRDAICRSIFMTLSKFWARFIFVSCFCR